MGKRLKWGCGSSAGVTLFFCICLSLMTVQGCSSIQNEIIPGPGDDYDPGAGGSATCENAGVAYAENPFRGWPQPGRGWADINYYYCAADYFEQFGRTHWGIDIDADQGEAVQATAPAIVVRAAHDTTYGMGKNVKICAASGWCAVYMHLDEWAVTVGQAVYPGTVLGYADNTGFSTGTHLHYQINNSSGQPVDPAPTFTLGPLAAHEE